MDANAEIGRLQNMNESLAGQIKQMDLPLPASVTYPDLMSKLDKLPEKFAKDQLAYVFDADAIDQISDVRAFSKRLIDVALDDSGAYINN